MLAPTLITPPRSTLLRRSALLIALAAALGNTLGCNSAPPVVATMMRGGPATAQAAQPAAATHTPTAWNSGSDAQQRVQWAEMRSSPGETAIATGVVWRAKTTATPDQQGPVLVVPQAPEQQPDGEPIPSPKTVPLDTLPGPGPGPGCGVGLGAPVPRAPTELRKMTLPTYTVAPPDILLIETTQGLPTQPIKGQHLVRPDGTINLGIYGSVFVAGMTLDQIKSAVVPAISSRLDPEAVKKNPVKAEDINVDVLAYNSKVYYVITDGGGFGEQVYSVPFTGNETVLDAMAKINGLPAVASKKHIWVARRTATCGANNTLPVDWCGITQRGETMTNYQLFPGDRVYVQADRLITCDNLLSKMLAPVERILGVTLLGSTTVNSIRNRNNSTNP
jgi:polysaccharide export outer membrane protein